MDKNKTENNPFKVPESYFSQLHDQIMAHAAESRLKDQAASDGFSVPDGYFETLHQRILNSRNNTAAASAVIIAQTPVKTLRSRRWVSYAAAACMTIGVGAFAFWQMPKKGSNNFEQHVAALSDADIINYLQYYSEAGDGTALAEQVNVDPENYGESYSQEDLESYLEQTL